MKKAIPIQLNEKKDSQIDQDIAMTQQERFYHMFRLIELATMFSKEKKIVQGEKENSFLLKKKAT